MERMLTNWWAANELECWASLVIFVVFGIFLTIRAWLDR
jgi:hypothetical protein